MRWWGKKAELVVLRIKTWAVIHLMWLHWHYTKGQVCLRRIQTASETSALHLRSSCQHSHKALAAPNLDGLFFRIQFKQCPDNKRQTSCLCVGCWGKSLTDLSYISSAHRFWADEPGPFNSQTCKYSPAPESHTGSLLALPSTEIKMPQVTKQLRCCCTTGTDPCSLPTVRLPSAERAGEKQ